MKTSELIKRAMEIKGISDYHQDKEFLYFYASEGLVAYANRINKFKIATDFGTFSNLPSFSQALLLELLYQYAVTPIEEREEPKKYKLRHRLTKDEYLNYVEDKKELEFSTGLEIGRFKTEFTIQEWEVLTGQTWEDLLLQFKTIEV